MSSLEVVPELNTYALTCITIGNGAISAAGGSAEHALETFRSETAEILLASLLETCGTARNVAEVRRQLSVLALKLDEISTP